MNSDLLKFKENNPNIIYEEKKDYFLAKNLWNDDTIEFNFKKTFNYSALTNVVLPEELVAIYHKDKNTLEIIAAPFLKNNKLFSRKFTVFYKSNKFDCFFDRISDSLKLLVDSVRIVDASTRTYHRNLPFLRDYFRGVLPKEFIEKSDARSFFIKGDFQKIDYNYIQFVKYINFYSKYFERSAPTIIVLEDSSLEKTFQEPCFTSLNTFPEIINANEIDAIILDIFSVANVTTDVRLKFIFYYQILEYASYYYLNNKLKNKLNSILMNPDLTVNAEMYSKNIIEQLKDNFSQRDDSAKIEQIVTELCTINDIKLEIECNIDYFTKDQTFEGGFILSQILKDKSGLDSMTDSDILKLVKNIEKIRNVLVHLRESRENKVILPTKSNHSLIMPYLYILRRIAEKVAIAF